MRLGSVQSWQPGLPRAPPLGHELAGEGHAQDGGPLGRPPCGPLLPTERPHRRAQEPAEPPRARGLLQGQGDPGGREDDLRGRLPDVREHRVLLHRADARVAPREGQQHCRLQAVPGGGQESAAELLPDLAEMNHQGGRQRSEGHCERLFSERAFPALVPLRLYALALGRCGAALWRISARLFTCAPGEGPSPFSMGRRRETHSRRLHRRSCR
mmetsp:Transcript_84019/g.232859  ORF Transcript_84019/g.232859 Transcript_84019/m.232859 type:complete len:213 (+) Transcript_84019:815-1453(+)